MEIHTRRFGPNERQLLGLLQSPQVGKPRRAAFLMCRPFGQEAVRTTPIFRAGSDRLAREGCPVLTFDAHGCGDAPGEIDGASLAEWALDTLVADEQLRVDAPGYPIHWFGMGLGANIAAAAALRAKDAPSCLVLWEPVLDGPAYLQRLMKVHRGELAREMGFEWEQLVRRGLAEEPELPGSVLGFTVGPRLHQDLLGLGSVPIENLVHRGIRTIIVADSAQSSKLNPAEKVGAHLQALEAATDWMSTEAFGTAIVPQEILRTLLSTL